MYKQTLSRFLLMVFVSLAVGCAASFPEVENDFEQNWQPTTYQSEVYLIPSAPESLARRIDLVRKAQQSIDMTYFSWDKDLVGLKLLNEIKHAADRGVKVRLTLDDLLVFNEKWLAELNHHHNIEIRLFNAFNSRKTGWLGRAVDFVGHRDTLDHRLHEKYFNVDQQWMILGGRNIGNAYFGYSQVGNFFDMDVLFRGEVIEPFSNNYHELWDSDLVVEATEKINVEASRTYPNFYKALALSVDQDSSLDAHIENTVASLGRIDFLAASVMPVFDSREKIEDLQPYFRARAENVVNDRLDNTKHVVISSPYIIPVEGKLSFIDKLREHDVEVELFTNSSSSNDSGFVPAIYQTSRDLMLNADVKLFEYKDKAKNDDHYFHVDTYYHNKTVIIDSQMTYIGSSNFDPRSDFLNIEFGLFVDSTDFAEQVKHYLTRQQSDLFWQVSEMKVIIRFGSRAMKSPLIIQTMAEHTVLLIGCLGKWV